MPTGAFDKDKLAETVTHIEKLEAEKAEAAENVKDAYNAAKDAGFDKKALKLTVRRRAMDEAQRAAADATTDVANLYLDALGDTPIEQAIKASA